MTDALAEFAGTAILMAIGLSAVTLDFSTRSPLYGWLGQPEFRRLATGIVFATAAALIVYSPLGRRSGGHLNPALTLGFLYLNKLKWRGAASYVVCQILGALVGAWIVLTAWGSWARNIHVGATVPGHLGLAAAFSAELIATFILFIVVFHFVDRPEVMRFTPIAAGLILITVVLIESPASTTSLNPARTLGPAVVSRTFTGVWVYLIAAPLGALLAAVLFTRNRGEIACGKLVHTDGYACHFRACRYRKGTAINPNS